MKKSFFILLVIACFSRNLYSQFNLSIDASKKNINQDYLLLLKSKADLRTDSIANEKILDLVQPHTIDSIITKNTSIIVCLWLDG